MYSDIVNFIKARYPGQDFIPLHEPRFVGNEKKYLNECVDSTFVSSVGKFVDDFEQRMAAYTGAKYAVAVTNGTLALHMALIVAGVQRNDIVITQALSFIATSNAISYIGAAPVFVDVDKATLGMSAEKLEKYLGEHAVIKSDGVCYHRETGQRIAACVPMHTFGHPCEIDTIRTICDKYNIILVEDAAESIGSYYKDKHTGVFGQVGVFSFNGNKTVTSGGGGAIVTNDEHIAKRAKYLTTQAKRPHKWDFFHTEIGYNYRLPNINAALAVAQLECLDAFVANKRATAAAYAKFFENTGIHFVKEPAHAKSNYWLNAILLKDKNERDEFLTFSNDNGVMTRPCWALMHRLPMFEKCMNDGLENSMYIEDRLVNIPSSVTV